MAEPQASPASIADPAPSESATSAALVTCRRGHSRNPENTRQRVLVRNGRESVIHECRLCVKLTAEARKARAQQ